MELKAVLSASGEMTGAVGVAKGEDGKTPVKGVDYFTAAEIAEIINAALAKADTKYVAQLAGKSLSANDYTDTEKAEVAKIKDKVGFTDYATAESGGVVKVSEIYGTNIKDGKLSLIPATDTDISQRLPIYHPIIPSNLDYAVRSVRPVRSGSIPDILALNTIYDVSERKTLTLKLPYAQRGDFIQVDFYSGETPTNLTITCSSGSLSDIDLIPEANTMYSLFFDWGTVYCDPASTAIMPNVSGWRFSYAAYPHEEV